MNSYTKKVVNTDYQNKLYLKEQAMQKPYNDNQLKLCEIVIEDCKGDMEQIKSQLIAAGFKPDSTLITSINIIITKLNRYEKS